MTPKRLLIIPAFNEVRTIGTVLPRSLPHVDGILVVDDGSTDGSAAVVAKLAREYPQVILLRHQQNRGKSGALLTAFAYTWRLIQEGALQEEDWVLTMDADGQHQPEEIPKLVAAAEARRADLLITRRDFQVYPAFKRAGNWALTLWASWLGGYRFHDVESGFRAFRAGVLSDLMRFFTGYRYGCDQEIAIIAVRRGWRVDNSWPTEIPYYRAGTRIRDGAINLWMGLTAWWRVRQRRVYSVPERVDAILDSARMVRPEDGLTLPGEVPWPAS